MPPTLRNRSIVRPLAARTAASVRAFALYQSRFRCAWLALLTMLAPALHAETKSTDWAADADEAYAAIKANHPEPFKFTSAAVFDSALATLKQRAPKMSWPEFVVALKQFTALTKDGHTNFYEDPDHGPGFAAQYPLRIYQFPDGLYVMRIAKGHEAVFGHPIETVNGRPAAEVIAALSTLTGGASPLWGLNWTPLALSYPGYLHGLHLADGSVDGPLRLAFRNAQGAPEEIALAPVPSGQEVEWARVLPTLNPAAKQPRYMVDEKNISLEYLPENKAVVVSYRAVADEPEPIAVFAARLEEFLAGHDVERLIFDVRNNGGGDNTLNQPLIHAAIRATRLNQPGHLFVLTDRGTFSAAMNFCTAMERETQALYVGEPTGLQPNHFGDATPHQLAHTGLTLYVSTLRWQDSSPLDQRRYLRPDLAAPMTFAEYVRGNDPGLQAALVYKAPADGKVMRPIDRWDRPSQKETPPSAGTRQ